MKTNVERHACVHHPEGHADENFCRVTNRQQKKNLDDNKGCCTSKCESKWRFCGACLLDGTSPLRTLQEMVCPVHGRVGKMSPKELREKFTPKLFQRATLQDKPKPAPRPVPEPEQKSPFTSEEIEMARQELARMAKAPGAKANLAPPVRRSQRKPVTDEADELSLEDEFKRVIARALQEETPRRSWEEVVGLHGAAVRGSGVKWTALVNPMEVSSALVHMTRTLNMTFKQAGQQFGWSPSWVEQMLLLQRLVPSIQALLHPNVPEGWRFKVHNALKLSSLTAQEQMELAKEKAIERVKKRRARGIVE